MGVFGMKKKTTRNRKPMTVDGRPYIASITAIYVAAGSPLTMRLTKRADYGHRSFCMFRGLTNHAYYFNYGEYDPEQSISLTQRVVADLIRFAHAQGWEPMKSRSNFKVESDNDAIRQIMQTVA